MKDNALDQRWSAVSLLRFAFPTIIMMLFMGLYTVVDTIFVSRYVNTDALSAVNIICPIINLTVGLGTMLAAGGNAVISRKMGAGREQEAKEDFTLLVLVAVTVGCLILAAGMLWMDQIIYALGASRRLFPYCKDYLWILLLFIPANMIQTMFANLFVTAGRPGMGLCLSVLAGLMNVALDYVFIVFCGLGISGAALGTGFGYLLPAVWGTVFFIRNRGGLSFTRPKWKGDVLRESCLNGSSEMVGQLAEAVTTFLFNRTMMGLAGEDGVAAITIMIYAQFLLHTLYIGFSMGVAPVIGFNYGKKDSTRQKKVLKICVCFMIIMSVFLTVVSWVGGPYIVGLFAPGTSEVYRLAANGWPVFSCGFLFCGLNIFTSSMFTALSKGKLSALLSFLRTFVLLAGGIAALPLAFGMTGVWLAVPVAEGVMCLVSGACFLSYWRKY